MIRIAKGLLLGQTIVCMLFLPLFFNAPLQMARTAQEARQLATHLSQQGSASTAQQAVDIADFLSEWRKMLPFAMAVPSVVGALIGLIGWEALRQKAKLPAKNAIEPTR